MNARYLLFFILLTHVPYIIHGTPLEELIQQQSIEAYKAFIAEVKKQTNQAQKIKNSGGKGFFETLWQLANGTKVNIDDAQAMIRFFQKKDYEVYAVCYYFDKTNEYLPRIQAIFATYAKGDQSSEHLKHIIHLHTIECLKENNINIPYGTPISELFNKKNNDGAYIIPDDIYFQLITEGLITTFLSQKIK